MRLLLVRHAKSDRPGDMDDHDRPLARRGVADAEAIGAHLAGLDLVPSRIVSSTAVRAASTADIIAAAAGREVITDPHIYGGGVAALLTAASGRGDVMVVGHEPTLSMAVEALSGALVTMVTSAVVCIDTTSDAAGTWRGTLRWMLTPEAVRGLRR
ncbi:MAG TPA: histidine phosphatase family protein [Acidimicrobiia bacterium]|nr:histidine phosphatase family protein [Acidimicrobiia bacterium]